ncbi:MAG: metal-dependent hydrolase [Gammaproteobacteria bacterium]|nr:MAG: metal-dependent hydrolase [Gammaproteobacteria bacterium]
MASVFSHGLVALVIGSVSAPRAIPKRFWALSIICSILPDADVIAFKFDIPYEHMFGHRGISHSLLFAAMLGIFVAFAFFSNMRTSVRWLLTLYFTLVTASHAVLDAMTNGGLGVAFFAPFDEARYFLPWRPIVVSPIGIGSFFSAWGMRVIVSELLWVGLPAAGLALPLILIRRFVVNRKTSPESELS